MPTIGGTVLQNGRRVPDREALVAGDRRWTWRELAADVARVATVLRSFGLKRGDRVAIVAANSPEYVIAELGGLLLGCVVVPVNARLAVPELEVVLADSAPAVVLSGDPCHDLVAAVMPQLAHASNHVMLDALMACATGAEPTADDGATEDGDAFIVYTSGTTGHPKGVLMDHHRAVWAAQSQITCMGLRDGERYLHLSPLYHSGGVVFLTATTLLGGTHVLVPGFEPASVLATLERERITAFLGVPTMYQQLLRHPDFDQRDLSALRTGVFGAAPMPARTITELLQRVPSLEIFQLCGQTEAGPTGLFSTTEQLQARPDSTGHQPQPFLEHRVMGGDGNDIKPGEVGELLFRGESIMKGYWNAPAATDEALRDGWLHTGDLFRLDPDGALVLVDRLKDMIITGGQNVYSAEVERVVLGHPAVLDCAVVGRPHAEYGETVVAAVVLADDATLSVEDLREHCATDLAHYKIPRDIMRMAEIPRNAGGKVQKQLLRTVPQEA